MQMEKIVEEYGKGLYAFCLYVARNKENAEDLFQQTFLVAFEKEELELDANPKSYLISIALNLWKNRLRKAARRKRLADVSFVEEWELDQLADEGDSVEELVEKRQEAEKLRSYVLDLPEKLRFVVLMYYMEEMSIAEIAKALQIPPGTVNSRLNKARKVLKERLDDGKREI